MDASTVRELVTSQATQAPHSVYALAEEGGTAVSYAQLAASCRRLCGVMRDLACQPGDTLSVVMPNGIGTLRVLLAALWGGRCVNPVNLLSQPDQMRYVIDHSDCRLVVTAPAWEEQVRAMLQSVQRPVAVLVCDPDSGCFDCESGSQDEDAPPAAPDSTALLMYTSGTTGRPKGVMLTQSNLVANAQAIAAEHRLQAADRVLGVLPLYHINAFAVTMLAPLASGGSVVLARKFSASQFWEHAVAAGCTWLNVVPTIVSYLLEGEVPPRGALGTVRFCRSASAPLPPEHLQGFEQKFGIGIVETMGLTETVAPAFSNPIERSRRKLGSVGLPSGCEARVVDAQLRPVPAGTTGEIVIRGPNVMRGYYKNAEATAAAFTPDGWLRSGDLGHQDGDGFFFVTGRLKELIIKGGENIAPREIDEALLRHPCVLEAASVGVPDRHYGQEIEAYLVLRKDAQLALEDLRRHCQEHLGRYKSPRALHVVEDLPRGPSGKVQRMKLLDLPADRIRSSFQLA